jgi:hypothetical protein
MDMQIKKALRPARYYFELALRIYVWVKLSLYGFGKILGGQFYRPGKFPTEIKLITLENAGGFDLAWTFFGFSQQYIYFIGISQIIGAFLLLFEKTKIAGMLILVPILLNIIVMDYIFGIPQGALLSAICYFTALCMIAYMNKRTIVRMIVAMTTVDNTGRITVKGKIISIVIAAVIVFILLLLENQLMRSTGG